MKEDKKIKCLQCNTELVWENDYHYDEVGLYGDGIVSLYSCYGKDCSVSFIEVYQQDIKKSKDENN